MNKWYLPRKLHSLEGGFHGVPASDWIGIWKRWFLRRRERTNKQFNRLMATNPKSNQGQVGGRRVQTPLRHPCSPIKLRIYMLLFSFNFEQTNYTIESTLHGILFTSCKTLETHSFAKLTRSFLKSCNSWRKIRTAHFLWSNLFLKQVV